jgi:tripartite-type tricarboxylate transporter receptor subunit TctC
MRVSAPTFRAFQRLLLSSCAAATMSAAYAGTDGVANFYRNKTVTIVVGYSAGGGYDIFARALARHMADHIPGRPTVLVQDMPGAGSIVAANYLYNVAPKDGTVFGTFARGVPMEPLIGTAKTMYQASKFTWLGSASYESSVCAFSHKAGIKTWSDVLTNEVTVAGEGSGSDPDTYATMMGNLFGAKLRLVTGYPGGDEMTMAIDRGEVDGRCGWSWTSIEATRPDWVSGPNKLDVVLQMTLDRNPELPDVPTVVEIAKTTDQQEIVKLIVSRQLLARPFAAPPGLPPERKEALIKAFAETMADPAYIADAHKLKLEVSPVSAQRATQVVDDLYKTPPEVLARARAVIAGNTTAAQ